MLPWLDIAPRLGKHDCAGPSRSRCGEMPLMLGLFPALPAGHCLRGCVARVSGVSGCRKVSKCKQLNIHSSSSMCELKYRSLSELKYAFFIFQCASWQWPAQRASWSQFAVIGAPREVVSAVIVPSASLGSNRRSRHRVLFAQLVLLQTLLHTLPTSATRALVRCDHVQSTGP